MGIDHTSFARPASHGGASCKLVVLAGLLVVIVSTSHTNQPVMGMGILYFVRLGGT
jgi:hypothetical protein